MTIIDVYKLLFGRKGIADGDVISMAEHGRAGGISSGTPFKGVQEIPLEQIVDKTDPNTIYIGEANHRTPLSAASWRIKRVSTSGTITTISFAGGTDKFDQVWDNRASLSYS